MPGSISQKMLDMLLPVAEALGEELLPYVAFVGGTPRLYWSLIPLRYTLSGLPRTWI